MSDSARNESPELARKRLAQASRNKDLSVRLGWALSIAEGVLLAIAAVALADYWFILPAWMRSVATGGVALLAAFGVFRMIRFFRRPTAIKEAALDLEAAKPELGCEISTAAEYLAGERQITHQFEPELVAALEANAAAELRQSQLPYKRRLIGPAVMFGLTCAAVLVFLAVAPGTFTALQRAVFPFSEAHYTQLQVFPGSVEVPIGSVLEITNIFTGRKPKNPQFHWRTGGRQQWETAPLATEPGGSQFVHAIRNIRESLQYCVTGGDAASEVYQVQAYHPPEVKDLSVRIELPRYTGRPPANQVSPEITALRGSNAEIELEPSTKLSSARLRFPGNSAETPLVPGPGGVWTAQLTITNDTEYWIDLFDEKGRHGGSTNAHPIRALSDTPPTVAIQLPGQDMRASSTNRIPLSISVTDDFGVGEVKVVFHKLGDPERVLPALRREALGKREVATAELDLSGIHLEQFDVVAYHAEAADDNTIDGPGIGKSEVYFVEITQLKPGPPNPQMPSPALNLLAVQKQIIADTAALESGSPVEAFGSLAVRQRDAADFGQVYLDGLNRGRAPAEAVAEMNSALSEMTTAAINLEARKHADALPAEERALAHLYQVLRAMPELEDMPTEPRRSTNAPPPSDILAVVLEAIRERKQPPPSEPQTLQNALEQAVALADAQAAVNAALRAAQRAGGDSGQEPGRQEGRQQGQLKSQANGQAQGQGQAQIKAEAQGQGQGQGQGNSNAQGEGKADGEGQGKEKGEPEQAQQPGDTSQEKPGVKDKHLASPSSEDRESQERHATPPEPESEAGGKGKGKGEGQALANGQGEGNAQGEGQPKNTSEQSPDDSKAQPRDPGDLAQREAEIQKLAEELAAHLERLGRNNARVGRNAGQNARLGAHKIADAINEIRKGRFGAAGVHGFQGELALREVAAQLARTARAQPELTDVASEDAPKEYEPLISEYFKRLSHAE